MRPFYVIYHVSEIRVGICGHVPRLAACSGIHQANTSSVPRTLYLASLFTLWGQFPGNTANVFIFTPP